MKKFAVLLAVIVLLAAAVVPAFAHTGATGKVVDSKTGTGWDYGGDVYVLENCVVDSNGNIISGTLVDGAGPQTTLSTAAGSEGNYNYTWAALTNNTICVYIVLVDPPGPYPAPPAITAGPLTNLTFITVSPLNFGNSATGTGPTAITLEGVSTGTQSSLPLAAGLAALLLVGVSFVAIRRRNAA